MTFHELYEYGMKSAPARSCIPRELVQSLPRLECINGRVVVQYWYYYRNASLPGQINDPLYYAAFDIHEEKLVEMKQLRHYAPMGNSWLDLVTCSAQMREAKYLEHCAQLLDRGDITEEEIIETQAMWLDCQARDIFPELYYRSGIRPEAVARLISPRWAEKSRYILEIWSTELMKCLYPKVPCSEEMDAIWFDPIFCAERDIFHALQERGPIPGIRLESDY